MGKIKKKLDNSEKVLKRIDLINSLKDYNKILLNLGYLHPNLIRDVAMVEDYYKLLNFDDEYQIMEIYDILAKKYRLDSRHVIRLIKKITIEV